MSASAVELALNSRSLQIHRAGRREATVLLGMEEQSAPDIQALSVDPGATTPSKGERAYPRVLEMNIVERAHMQDCASVDLRPPQLQYALYPGAKDRDASKVDVSTRLCACQEPAQEGPLKVRCMGQASPPQLGSSRPKSATSPFAAFVATVSSAGWHSPQLSPNRFLASDTSLGSRDFARPIVGASLDEWRPLVNPR